MNWIEFNNENESPAHGEVVLCQTDMTENPLTFHVLSWYDDEVQRFRPTDGLEKVTSCFQHPVTHWARLTPARSKQYLNSLNTY